MVSVAARTKVRDKGLNHHQGPALAHPITAAIRLTLILVTITATAQIIPSLLHPLFGSIPSDLHKESTTKALFALSAVLLASCPQLLALDNAIAAGLAGLDLVIIATAYKKAARLGGIWLGPIGGATGTLAVLSLGPALLGSLMWSKTLKTLWTSNGTALKDRELRIFVLAAIGLLWLGVELALRGIGNEIGSDLISRLITIFRPEVRHPLFVLIGSSGLWLVQSWLETQRARPGSPFASTLHLLTLFLIGNIALGLLRPRVFPYTVSLPPNLNSPAGAPRDRPAPAVRILNSTRSITGQIVVAENVEYGYRFMRCDHSLLGGRWAREGQDGQTEFGDSIFSTFVLQDAAKLVHRSEPYRPRAKLLAEIIGLGVGIAAQSLMDDGISVRITEIDPAVYEAAHRYFGLRAPSRLELDDGAKVIETRATAIRKSGRPLHPVEQTDFVIHDCFTGGSVPAELFTRDFWWDLTMSMKTDGVLVVNFAGIIQSRASQAVFATLLDVFPQCRAFQDVHGMPDNATGKELINMVIFCTMVHSPLLTFRVPEPRDLGYSPLRQEVLTTFLPHEISIADQLGSSAWQSFWIDDVDGNNDRTAHEVQDDDDDNNEGEYYRPKPDDAPDTQRKEGERDLILRRGHGMDQLDKWQVDSAVATWTAMRTIMPVEGWLAY